MTNIGPNQLVYEGELEGATSAAEYASKIAKRGLHFHIYSDNQAGLWRLSTPSDNPGQACQIRAIQATKSANRKGASITFKWVPGHTDIQGNEQADQLAKDATTIQPKTRVLSFAMLGAKIKRVTQDEWLAKLRKHDQNNPQHSNPLSYHKFFPWSIISKLRTPVGNPREITSAFYQLKLSHEYMKSYLYRLGHTNNHRCRCGRPETPEHLLISCPEIGEARKEIKKLIKHPLTLQKLLHTTQGTMATIAFLKTTKIATRKWLQ